MIDIERLDALVGQGFLSRVLGPHGLTLFNYTPQQQFKGTWDEVTLNCRGVVLDATGAVQSRPFRKFFNLHEHANPALPDLPVEPFTVYEKLDGSLIAASTLPDGEVLLTSRGSFSSDQAQAAATLWAQRYADVAIPKGQTWCFELLAPWNRVVVNYGDRNDLVLLAVLDNATGDDFALPNWPGPIVRSFDGLDDFDVIKRRLDSLPADEEGYVLRFESGLRVKAKGAEYVRLHKLLTGVTARTIWECHANGIGIAEIVDRVPDEFFAWVTTTSSQLLATYDEIERDAAARHDDVVGLPTRKEQALAVAGYEHRAVVFRMLDAKPYADVIWKRTRPEAERPYRPDIDGGG